MGLSRLHSTFDKFHTVPEHHPGQANQVHIGTWRNQTVAIRVPNRAHQSVNEFYDGVEFLFNLRHIQPYHYSNMYRVLKQNSILPIPRLLTLSPFEASQIAPTHQFVQGSACTSFDALSAEGAFAFGKHLARLHSVHNSTYGAIGNASPGLRFHHQLAKTIEYLISHYPYDELTVHIAKKVAAQIRVLPAPILFCPVMLDLDPSQYFIQNGRMTDLIDIDFYVYAPSTLELIALERLLPNRLTALFIAGYECVRPFPSLQAIREVYRVFNRLICVQGDEPYPIWHDAPANFDIVLGKS